MDKKYFKMIIISVIIVLVGFGIYLIVSKFSDKKKEYTYLKRYSANEYIPTYVTSSDMAKIYYNDYMYYAKYDKEKAYELLNEEYRKAKFNSFDAFKKFIDTIVNLNEKPEKFSVNAGTSGKIYKIYLPSNTVIFVTQGVMQYSVYLDDKTIEIR